MTGALEQHLRARAWKDDAFRQEFLANPKAVLERDYAAWFPAEKISSKLSIKVVEEEEQTLCFVLPPKAPTALLEMEELEDADVSVVSGGGRTGKICPTIGCTKEGCTTKTYCWWKCSNSIKSAISKIL